MMLYNPKLANRAKKQWTVKPKLEIISKFKHSAHLMTKVNSEKQDLRHDVKSSFTNFTSYPYNMYFQKCVQMKVY